MAFCKEYNAKTPDKPGYLIPVEITAFDTMLWRYCSFESPELDVIGFTTIYETVRTEMATYNAFHLVGSLNSHPDGVTSPGEMIYELYKAKRHLRGGIKDRIADFVHGQDGLGTPPKGSAIAQSAAKFLIKKCKEFPGEVTVVALGPLTNLAKVIEDNRTFRKNVGQIIVLGGAFMVNGI